MRVGVLCAKSLSCVQPCNPIDCSLPGSSVHGDSRGKNTGVGCHALLGTGRKWIENDKEETIEVEEILAELI